MASDNLTINTDQVEQIAQNIEDLNKKLSQELQDSKATIDALPQIWTGDASSETVSSFNSFATKYFQNYEDTIKQYVNFLRSVAQRYVETETTNVQLADEFK